MINGGLFYAIATFFVAIASRRVGEKQIKVAILATSI
jgi:hypothetical protein